MNLGKTTAPSLYYLSTHHFSPPDILRAEQNVARARRSLATVDLHNRPLPLIPTYSLPLFNFVEAGISTIADTCPRIQFVVCKVSIKWSVLRVLSTLKAWLCWSVEFWACRMLTYGWPRRCCQQHAMTVLSRRSIQRSAPGFFESPLRCRVEQRRERRQSKEAHGSGA
jgi:hypothetical protein